MMSRYTYIVQRKSCYICVPLIIEVYGDLNQEAHDHQAINCVAQKLPVQSRPKYTCAAIWVSL